MKKEEEILSRITGYSIQELHERLTEPILQPYDCLMAMIEFAEQQANGVNTSHEPALHKHGVTNRTCVTCLYCQANPSSEFKYDKHKCTLVKPFVNITDATKFVCDEWTEIPF